MLDLNFQDNPVLPLRFEIEFDESGFLSRFPLSMLRGSIAHSFSNLFPHDYQAVFEPTNHGFIPEVGKVNTAPVGYVLIPSANQPKDHRRMVFNLVLWGEMIVYAQNIINSVVYCGIEGMLDNKQTFRVNAITPFFISQEMQSDWHSNSDSSLAIESVKAGFLMEEWKMAFQIPDQLQVELLSPLRIQHQKSYILSPQDFEFPIFYTSLIRRLKLITTNYFLKDSWDEKELLALGGRVWISEKHNLYTQQLKRKKSETISKISMDGLMGSFTVSGDLRSILPFLWLGQYLQVGSMTSHGLGSYRLVKHK